MPFARIIAPMSLVISSQVLYFTVSAGSVSSGQTHSCPQFMQHKKCSFVALDTELALDLQWVHAMCYSDRDRTFNFPFLFTLSILSEKGSLMSPAYLLYAFSE